MARKVDHAKAKAARQKKIAIGLGVLLVAVLAYQGPKTLKMLKGPAAPAAAPATTAPVATPTTEAAVPPLGAPAPSVSSPAASQPAVLASSDQLPSPGAGQLLSFELFESKDPFVQQADVDGSATEGQGQCEAAAGASEPAPIVPEAGAPAKPGETAVPQGSESGSTPPAASKRVPLAQTTTISVNGVSESVAPGTEFPLEDPIFMLVSTASDGKSVQIGVAGGEYADGKDTITLKLGKPLTLQNTADGSRYELVLETVAGFVPPAAKK
jgi:hypothetical protein